MRAFMMEKPAHLTAEPPCSLPPPSDLLPPTLLTPLYPSALSLSLLAPSNFLPYNPFGVNVSVKAFTAKLMASSSRALK